MSVWLDKVRRCLDSGHRPSRRTTVRPKFQKFRWRSFLFESRIQTVLPWRPDGRTSAASNFHIESSRVRTRRMVVRTVDLMQAISIFDVHVVRTVAAIFPYLCLERNPKALVEHWGKRPHGCKQEQFEASRHKGRSGRKVLIVRMDDVVDCRSFGQFDTSSGRMVL
jgi:hypothetical protein